MMACRWLWSLLRGWVSMKHKTKKKGSGSYDKMAESENNHESRLLSHSDTVPANLPELLDRGWKIYEEVDSTDLPLGSSSIQVGVKRGIGMLEEASGMVAQLDLFSRNEELEEVSTADLKYLLLPALLGALTMKQTNRDKRLHIVQTARAYFMDFLQKCKDYNISRFKMPTKAEREPSCGDTPENGSAEVKSAPCQPDLVGMAAQRQSKIERYRQKKALETRLSTIKRAIDSGQGDDEVNRDFYLLNIQRWVTVCLEEIESIDQELEILNKMDVLKQGAAMQPSQPVRPPMKPFILTKDSIQAKVFGPGYPSLPTMTVDDWYDQHKKHGVMPDQGIAKRVAADDDAMVGEEEEKEKKAEQDNEEALLKARKWDDWKDTHRRGYGNRHNMG